MELVLNYFSSILDKFCVLICQCFSQKKKKKKKSKSNGQTNNQFIFHELGLTLTYFPID